MYDLLIKGGRVIDPAQQHNKQMDVAVRGDKIAGVLPDIPAAAAGKVIDAAGKIVTPGLIDLHTHVCHGVLNNGARLRTHRNHVQVSGAGPLSGGSGFDDDHQSGQSNPY